MFGHRFFGARYYGPAYWGDGGGLPPAPTTPVIDGAGNLDWLNKGPGRKKRKSKVIRFSDFETREAYEAELQKAAEALAAQAIPVSSVSAETGAVEDDELEDDEILLMAIMRVIH